MGRQQRQGGDGRTVAERFAKVRAVEARGHETGRKRIAGARDVDDRFERGRRECRDGRLIECDDRSAAARYHAGHQSSAAKQPRPSFRVHRSFTGESLRFGRVHEQAVEVSQAGAEPYDLGWGDRDCRDR